MNVTQRQNACLVKKKLVFACVAILVCFLPSDGQASVGRDEPDLCIRAARTASERTGVPLDILIAVTLAETGRTTEGGFRPWPWAINQAGKGHWFSTVDDAVQFAETQLDLGLRNFDVGCFQINHRWHSKGFRSTLDMFNPDSNAIYAAQFLAGLYDETGDWSMAAAAYHSRTPAEAAPYRAKFDAILADLQNLPATDNSQIAALPRINGFPLLKAGLPGNSASLVPVLSAGIRLIGAQP